ncbi:MAG TPA: acyl-CoA dehydrogenase family protein, partial [Solirubrobacteraceae bacterium]|nr:acyl-CoA dehydrogenase family protein [Solirubrobacteraceae bacterium]
MDVAARIGAEVAGPAAAEVDEQARFPDEAVNAFREAGLLSAMVPTRLGGAGVSPSEMAAAVRMMARHCCSSALVLAMHSMEISNLARHGTTEPLQELQREVVAEQLLVANANSEVGTGGDVSRSVCSLEREGGRVMLRKEALAISYGEHADLITATARRTPESEAGDQVQVILRRPQLEPRTDWDVMGLRGTCSRGFLLTAEVDEDLVYPVPFSMIGSAGGLQAQLLFLSAVWVGLAEASAFKAHGYVRAAARRNPEVTPPSALRLAELSAILDQGRALLESVARAVDAADASSIDDPSLLASLRTLKISTSRTGVDIARRALEICGIAGYHRNSEFSLDRLVRDAHGGLVMVSNDRYLWANADM